jgi:digeranylgeranylglycerophospholipid reductase
MAIQGLAKVESYDVLVVGAGPSGSTAAKYAANAGCRTLLIEKRAEIGVPVRCGEGIAKGWLEEIGVPPSPKFVAHEVKGARVFAPDGTCITIDATLAGNEVGYTVERDLFDRYLAADAARAGAEIRIRTSAVSLLKEDGRVVGAACEHMGRTYDVRAKLVIGADGFESQVGRWAGLATHLKAGDIDACLEYTMVGVEGDPEFDEFYLGSCAPGGYAWVFWKGEDVANVGLGVNLLRLRDKAEVKTYLDRLLREHPSLGRGNVLSEIAGGVSVSPPLERTVTDGCALVGDAARMIDPLTGGGILNGCVAGRYAGEVAGEALEAHDFSAGFLQRYERRWRERFEEHLYRNYMLKERLRMMDDATINRLVRAVSDLALTEISGPAILRALRERHPEILEELNLS